VRVEPAQVEFRDAFARRQLLVNADGHDATRQARYISRKPEVATVDAGGYIVPRANGTTDVEITLNGQVTVVPVSVTGFESIRSVDFVTEVEPLLSRFGCNSGGCHGKASGQNGFKLSSTTTRWSAKAAVDESWCRLRKKVCCCSRDRERSRTVVADVWTRIPNPIA
jgi:hypothetical protein